MLITGSNSYCYYCDINIYIQMNTYVRIRTYVYIFIRTYVYEYVRTYICVSVYTYKYTLRIAFVHDVKRQLRFVRDYLKEVGDRRKITFPMTFLTQSPLLTSISTKLAPLTDTCKWPVWCTDWSYVMNACGACINDHGLRPAYVH